MSSPQFKAAQTFVIRFGEHNGKTIDKIAESDKGLKYLDWLRGQNYLRDPARMHIEYYLSDPTIKKELEKIL